jgi:MFS family permease
MTPSSLLTTPYCHVAGTMLALVAGPFLAHAYGWQSIFIATGVLGLTWALLFGLLAAARPEQHKFITTPELQTIQRSRPPRAPPASVPWRAILTNR